MFDCTARSIYPALFEGERKRPAISACKADEPCRIFLKFFFADCAFILGGAQLHFCDQTAKVLITCAGRNKKRQPELMVFICTGEDARAPTTNWVWGRGRLRPRTLNEIARDLRSDMRLDSRLLRRHMKTWGAVNTIAIEQRHRGHFQFSAARDQGFGQGRALKKTERGAGVEFNILRH
jgi:hypothetical protein